MRSCMWRTTPHNGVYQDTIHGQRFWMFSTSCSVGLIGGRCFENRLIQSDCRCRYIFLSCHGGDSQWCRWIWMWIWLHFIFPRVEWLMATVFFFMFGIIYIIQRYLATNIDRPLFSINSVAICAFFFFLQFNFKLSNRKLDVLFNMSQRWRLNQQIAKLKRFFQYTYHCESSPYDVLSCKHRRVPNMAALKLVPNRNH